MAPMLPLFQSNGTLQVPEIRKGFIFYITYRSFPLLSIVILSSHPFPNDSLVTIECIFRMTLQIVSRLTYVRSKMLAGGN